MVNVITKKITENDIIYTVEEHYDYHGNYVYRKWFYNGKLYRKGGPAIECINGYEAWIKYNKKHREDGPAVTYSDGRKEYYLNNIYYSNIKSDDDWIVFNIII